MLILKVLLLTIIMANDMDLRTPFDLDAIIFRTIKHPLPYYAYVSSIFDSKFCNKSILKEDLVDEGIIVDQSGYKKVPNNVVDRLRNFFTTHVKSIVTSDGDDCQLKVDKIVFKTIRRTCFSVLETAQHFNTANTAYHKEDTRHEDIDDTESYIVYLDISHLYPIRTEFIDAVDWTKIHLTIRPDPNVNATTVNASNTGGNNSTDIDRLLAAMDQQYKDAHDLKEETLVKYDPVTGKGVPEECILRHDMYNKTNNIMTKSEMKKFKIQECFDA